MPEPERAGTKARNIAPRSKGLVGDFRAMEGFEPIADGIVENNQTSDMPLISERSRAAGDRHARLLEARRQRVERGSVRNLPTEEARALATVLGDENALL